MPLGVMERVVEAAAALGALVDLTGGAPELNPNFRRLCTALRAQGSDVQVRTNLTVLLEPGMEDLPRFFREEGVRLVASMPCYMEENVRAQRGAGRLRAERRGAAAAECAGLRPGAGPATEPGLQPGRRRSCRRSRRSWRRTTAASSASGSASRSPTC